MIKLFIGHHLVNQQPLAVQHGSGGSRSGSQHHQMGSGPPPEAVVSNVRLDNNPKKRMISQQQHQMVSVHPFDHFIRNSI